MNSSAQEGYVFIIAAAAMESDTGESARRDPFRWHHSRGEKPCSQGQLRLKRQQPLLRLAGSGFHLDGTLRSGLRLHHDQAAYRKESELCATPRGSREPSDKGGLWSARQ